MINKFPWEQFDRVTFEKGICIKKHDTGGWSYLNSEEPMFVSDPKNIMVSLGVRPVLAEGFNDHNRVSFILPAMRGRLLEIYLSEMDLPKHLAFIMGSMLAHCSSLARFYSEECSWFIENYAKKIDEKVRPSQKRIFVRSGEPLYAFEALVTKIIVGYEYLRFPIWKRYKSGKDSPRNFLETVKNCKFPSAMEKRIQLSIESCYLPAKKFRGCIREHIRIGSSSWCLFEKNIHSLWLFAARLPDNPEERSANDFQFDQGLDALSVAWEYVSEFFSLIDIILGKGNLSSS